VLGLAFIIGTVTFPYAPPCVRILKDSRSIKPGQAPILGLYNVHGARYLLLIVNIAAGCILLSKPMGVGALAAFLWQILLLVEMLDLNDIRAEVVGPVMFGILGNFYFFKTGHQAVLSTIQWDSAFIPLFALRYPWSPIFVTLNTFAGQILAATAVPLVALWKVGPDKRGVLETVSRTFGVFVSYFAVEALATMMWAGYLRRHLMLYRVFSPRFMTAAVVLLLVDCIGILVTMLGVRSNILAIMFVFEWRWTN
jgi:GPI ethanolamine phosphate transferase 3 subunit O